MTGEVKPGDADAPAGFIDAAARSEFARLAAVIFLTAMTNQQSVLLAVVWEDVGFSPTSSCSSPSMACRWWR